MQKATDKTALLGLIQKMHMVKVARFPLGFSHFTGRDTQGATGIPGMLPSLLLVQLARLARLKLLCSKPMGLLLGTEAPLMTPSGMKLNLFLLCGKSVTKCLFTPPWFALAAKMRSWVVDATLIAH